jgi:hypothetical protein
VGGLKKRFELLWPYLKYRLYHLKLGKQNYRRKDVVLFYFTPDLNFRSGGILSIYFLLEQTVKLLKQSVVLPVTLSRLPNYTKIDWFENDWNIHNIYYIKKQLLKSEKILVFVPECFYDSFCNQITYYDLFVLAKKMKVVILNQNDTLVPPAEKLLDSKSMFASLTMTLAFEANQNNVYSYLDSGPYFLSSWFYNYTIEDVPFEWKEQVCIISPDDHPAKREIVEILENECKLKCIEVKNMDFKDFQVLQRIAKWSISFGEGYDNYFAGAFVKSGIGFCVYNPTFFPTGITKENLPKSVFNSFECMKNGIVDVIKDLDVKTNYEEYASKYKGLILNNNSPHKVINNLKHFYNKEL